MLDVFPSETSDLTILRVRFVRNIGDSRAYDTIELNCNDVLGIRKWTPCPLAEMEERIAKRLAAVQREAEALTALVRAHQGQDFR